MYVYSPPPHLEYAYRLFHLETGLPVPLVVAYVSCSVWVQDRRKQPRVHSIPEN